MSIHSFQKLVAVRIALVSLLLASIVAPLAWWVARGKAEETIISLATESRRAIDQHHANDLTGEEAVGNARNAAAAITGGLFDIAEIYDSAGRKLAKSMTLHALDRVGSAQAPRAQLQSTFV